MILTYVIVFTLIGSVLSLIGGIVLLSRKTIKENFAKNLIAFAAGAMIFVVVEEVIPESQRNRNTDLATAGAMVGFVVMMVLDVAFS